MNVHAREGPEKSLGEEALASEEIDQGNAVQKGGGEKRHHGQATEKPFGRNAGSCQCVGIDESKGDREERRDEGNKKAVAQGTGQGRGVEIVNEVFQAHKKPLLVCHAFREELEKRQQHHDDHPGKHEQNESAADPGFPVETDSQSLFSFAEHQSLPVFK